MSGEVPQKVIGFSPPRRRPGSPGEGHTVVMGSPPSADVWLDERITLGASSIDGNGLFFAASVPVASVVIRLGGSLVSTERLQALIETARHDPEALFIDTITIDEGEHLVLPPRTPVHFATTAATPRSGTSRRTSSQRRARSSPARRPPSTTGHSPALPVFTWPARAGR